MATARSLLLLLAVGLGTIAMSIHLRDTLAPAFSTRQPTQVQQGVDQEQDLDQEQVMNQIADQHVQARHDVAESTQVKLAGYMNRYWLHAVRNKTVLLCWWLVASVLLVSVLLTRSRARRAASSSARCLHVQVPVQPINALNSIDESCEWQPDDQTPTSSASPSSLLSPRTKTLASPRRHRDAGYVRDVNDLPEDWKAELRATSKGKPSLSCNVQEAEDTFDEDHCIDDDDDLNLEVGRIRSISQPSHQSSVLYTWWNRSETVRTPRHAEEEASNTLTYAISACELQLASLENRVKEMSECPTNAPEKLDTFKQDCTRLVDELKEVSAQALEDGCNRQLGGMESFERANHAIDDVAILLQKCASLRWDADLKQLA